VHTKENTTKLCDNCDADAGILLCKECGILCCQDCDRVLHKNPQKKHHQREFLTGEEYVQFEPSIQPPKHIPDSWQSDKVRIKPQNKTLALSCFVVVLFGLLSVWKVFDVQLGTLLESLYSELLDKYQLRSVTVLDSFTDGVFMAADMVQTYHNFGQINVTAVQLVLHYNCSHCATMLLLL
jgi:hypothetical protein